MERPTFAVILIFPSPSYGMDKLQTLVTGFGSSHSRWYFDGNTYEWLPGGMKVTPGFLGYENACYYRYRRVWTPDEIERGYAWIDRWKRAPYNYAAYASMLLVAPTRKFWYAIHWFPFSNPDVWGFECYWATAQFAAWSVGDLWAERTPTLTLGQDFGESRDIVQGDPRDWGLMINGGTR